MKLVDYAALTDVGRQRDHNEDSHLALADIGLLAVADGMGGLEHGEVASSTALSLLRAAQAALRPMVEAVDASPTRGPRSQLAQAMEQLSNLASLRIQQVTGGAASGTTLVAACVAGGHLLVANTGDSRAYLLRDGRLRCLTVDHTVAAERLRAGLISQEEHDASPYQHMLTQALGTQGEVDPDIFDEPLADGDVVLLCSDGLTGPVSEDRVAELLAEHADLAAAAQALIAEANAEGGPDNITVLLYRARVGRSAEALDAHREALLGAPAARFLTALDHALLRHYFDLVEIPAGQPFDPGAGLHLLVSGRAIEQGEERHVSGLLGLRAFFTDGEDAPEAEALTDCEALVLSPEAYEALESRRPHVAARLLRGLLSLALG